MEKTVILLEDISSGNFTKVAAESLDYAAKVTSSPGKTKILVLAMGASEYYGPNRNGDGFRESELIKHHHTFKTNSHVFRSHVNKDPAKALGKVLESFYNHNMHRVELILELDNKLAASEVTKIKEGKDVAVSMGCRIKYDVCSICKNKAPTRAEYCKHLKYEMGDIYPDGRIVFADNPKPNFFDISMVVRPADKTGYMLKKVARDGCSPVIGEKSTDIASKVASLTVLASYLRKAADIDKTITGIAVGVAPEDISTTELSAKEKILSKKWIASLTPKVVSAYSDISPDKLKSLSKLDFIEVIKLLSKEGVFLMTEEFLDLLFIKLLGKPAPVALGNKLLSLQEDIFSVLAKHPEIPAVAIQDAVIPAKIPVSIASAKESRKKLSSFRKTRFSRDTKLDANLCKVAGYGAVLYSAYAAALLDSSFSQEKLAGLSNEKTMQGGLVGTNNKFKYLEARSIDILRNKKKFVKLSTETQLNNVDLFTSSPAHYYFTVGYELLTT